MTKMILILLFIRRYPYRDIIFCAHQRYGPWTQNRVLKSQPKQNPRTLLTNTSHPAGSDLDLTTYPSAQRQKLPAHERLRLRKEFREIRRHLSWIAFPFPPWNSDQHSSITIFLDMTRAATYLWLITLIGCISYSHGLVSGIICRPVTAKAVRRGVLSQSTTLQLFDPAAVDTMTNTAEIATNTFFTSFLARTVGTIVGNLLAALAFKYASDLIFNKKREEEEKQKVIAAATPAPEISQNAWIKLIFCIMIDLGSDASFLLPGIGEIEDVAWAPVSAYMLNLLFGSNVVSSLEFAKEILPGTDILPVATIAWVLQNVFVGSPITSALGLKKKEVDVSADSNGSERKVEKIQVEKKESMSPEMDAWDNKYNNKV